MSTVIQQTTERRTSFDFTRFNEAVLEQGTESAFTIIYRYMKGKDVQTLLFEHPAIKKVPKSKRNGVKENDAESIKWVVRAIINTLVETCDGDIARLSWKSDDRTWRTTIGKLRSRVKPQSKQTKGDSASNELNGVTASSNKIAQTQPSKPSRFSKEKRKERKEARGMSRSARRRGTNLRSKRKQTAKH